VTYVEHSTPLGPVIERCPECMGPLVRAPWGKHCPACRPPESMDSVYMEDQLEEAMRDQGWEAG